MKALAHKHAVELLTAAASVALLDVIQRPQPGNLLGHSQGDRLIDRLMRNPLKRTLHGTQQPRSRI